MTIIGLKELRANMEEVAERVSRGESFTVVKRSKPVFQVSPVTKDAAKHEREVSEWTRHFIARYRAAFEALADK